ncbi:MAG: alpha-L-rhamnosidase N-terminal domain-containing protein [Cytophagaceae bacterium]|nr:alpha-L-rhamnosidase N-terminal domain-containing protein [Cytophagaceae bacterium]
MRNSLLFLLFVAVIHHPATAQAPTPAINPELLTKRWPAAWIAPPGVSLKEYGVFHFRKTIDLPEKPGQFVVHVSADNRYQLFINGQLVSLGPARGDVAHWRFETVDLAPFLSRGKNTLAAVVWNFGSHAPLAQMSYQTGLIVQGNSATEAIVNTGTDAGWKVIRNEAYTPIPWGPVAKLDNYWYFVVGATDEVDAARYPWGWQTADYDDSAWQAPRKLAQGKTDGVSGDVNWNLIPRTIPPLESREQTFAAVRRATGLTVPPDFFTGKTELTIPANTTVSVLLDQGVLTTAYPRLLVSGGKGSLVKLTYAEALFDSTKEKKARNRVEGMQLIGFDDRFRPDGGARRSFEPLWYRTFRYVQLDVKTGTEPLTIHRLDSRFTAYPFQEKARFSSSDSSLKAIWNIGWRTARLCANETYMDCPYYEQLQYVGDTRIQALISLYVSGDDRLMRNALQQFNHSRIPEGITQSRYPSELMQITPTFSLAWVLMVHDYWMHRADDGFVKSFLPGIRGVLDWFETQVNERGLVKTLPYYDFFDSQYPLHEIARKSEGRGLTVSTLYFAYALDHAVALFGRYGKPGEADYYRRLSAKLKKATYLQCYDSARGLWADSPTKTHYSQHASVMAVLTDAAPVADQPRLMRRVLTDTSLIQAATYFQFYNAQALRKAGLADEYLPSLGAWRGMVAQGLSTFAEWEVEPRSDCHAWSASPNYYFLSLVTGIVPASPGFQTVRIQPALGPLTEVDGTMPHPAGEIRVSLKRVGKTGVSGTVILPAGLRGEFGWNGKMIALKPGINSIDRP